MQDFRIVNSKRFPLNMYAEDPLAFYRFEHRATIEWGQREFMLLIDCHPEEMKAYLEEITHGDMKIINDDKLYEAIMAFVRDYSTKHQNLFEVLPPIFKPGRMG